MKATGLLRLGAWLTAAALCGAATLSWSDPPAAHASPPEAAPPPPALRWIPSDPAVHAARTVIYRSNLFRLARRPTEVAFRQPAVPPHVVAEVEPPPRQYPNLRLGGILGGPPWSAVVEGFPGREPGMLLGVGEMWEEYRLEEIRPDTAILSAPDTTFVLTLDRPWN